MYGGVNTVYMQFNELSLKVMVSYALLILISWNVVIFTNKHLENVCLI